jgi:cysteine-rich repeat protein
MNKKFLALASKTGLAFLLTATLGCANDDPPAPIEDNRVYEACGNGDLDAGEVCDDGDTLDGDGCNGDCKIEDPSVTGGYSFEPRPSTDGGTDGPHSCDSHEHDCDCDCDCPKDEDCPNDDDDCPKDDDDCPKPPEEDVCPLTQGFWKNHPEDWPVETLTLGDETFTQDELLAILNAPPAGGDASLILAHQLIAALLNIASGTDDDPVDDEIAEAQLLLEDCDLIEDGDFGCEPVGEDRERMIALADTLDDFNNGEFSEGCEDD